MMISAWPERTRRNAQKTGLSETKSPPHFGPGTQISENVAGGPEVLGDASREGILVRYAKGCQDWPTSATFYCRHRAGSDSPPLWDL